VPLFVRQVLPDGVDQGIGAALVEQHRDRRELAVRAPVHQVCDHGVRPAVDLLLTGLVEVELRDTGSGTERENLVSDAKENDKWRKPRGRILMPERGAELPVVVMKPL